METTTNHSTEFEIILLGSIFLEPSLVLDCQDAGITPESFKPGTMRPEIWEALVYLHDHKEDISELSVCGCVEGRGLELAYLDLVGLTDKVDTTSGFSHALRKIRELDRLRQLRIALRSATEASQLPKLDWSEVVDSILPFTSEVETILATSGETSGKEDARSAIRRVEDIILGKPDPRKFISTGIPKMDEKCKGFAQDELVVFASRPSRGKTSFLTQCATANLDLGKKVVIFSLEMSRQAIVECMATIKSKVNSWTLDRDLREKQIAYKDSLEWLHDLLDERLFVYDSRDISTVEQVTSRTKALVQRHNGLDLVGIDYMQIMDTSRSFGSQHEKVSEVSRQLKALCIQSGCTMLALAQLNRETETKGRKPMISDLSSSGMIEQDADLICLNYRGPRSFDLHSKDFTGPVDQTEGGLHGMITCFPWLREDAGRPWT